MYLPHPSPLPTASLGEGGRHDNASRENVMIMPHGDIRYYVPTNARSQTAPSD